MSIESELLAAYDELEAPPPGLLGRILAAAAVDADRRPPATEIQPARRRATRAERLVPLPRGLGRGPASRSTPSRRRLLPALVPLLCLLLGVLALVLRGAARPDASSSSSAPAAPVRPVDLRGLTAAPAVRDPALVRALTRPAPGALVAGRARVGPVRLLLADIGPRRHRLYAWLTRDGGACYVLAGAGGCTRTVGLSPAPLSTAGDLGATPSAAGLVPGTDPPLLAGLVRDDVVRVDVLAGGRLRRARLGQGAFAYQLPLDDQAASWQRLRLTYRSGPVRWVDVSRSSIARPGSVLLPGVGGGAAGVLVGLPRGWSARPAAADERGPDGSIPRLVAASSPLALRGPLRGGCPASAGAAGDVAVLIVGELPTRSAGAAPTRRRLDRLDLRPRGVPCWSGRGSRTDIVVAVGRRLRVTALVGRRETDVRRRELRAVAESVAVGDGR